MQPNQSKAASKKSEWRRPSLTGRERLCCARLGFQIRTDAFKKPVWIEQVFSAAGANLKKGLTLVWFITINKRMLERLPLRLSLLRGNRFFVQLDAMIAQLQTCEHDVLYPVDKRVYTLKMLFSLGFEYGP